MFVVGTLVLNLFAALIWDAFPYENLFIRFSIIILLTLILYFLFRLLRKRINTKLQIDRGENVPSVEHVVTGLSWLNHPLEDEEKKERPSNLRLVLNLIEKHHESLQTLHVIVSDASGVLRSKSELQRWYEAADPSFNIDYINIKDGYDMGEVFEETKRSLKALIDKGIDVNTQLLLDVTAGTAAISAGMTMAALSTGADITYQATEYSVNNQLRGKTTWQFYKNRIVQIWESYQL